MKVLKFGGTSVEDAAAMRAAFRIIDSAREDAVLVVVSACAGVTNSLLSIAKKSVTNLQEEAIIDLENLIRRHKTIARQLLAGSREAVERTLDAHLADLTQLIKSLAVLKVLPPQTLDQCVAHGEQWSSMLMTAGLQESGIEAVNVDARSVMITDETFTQAMPQFEIIQASAARFFLPHLKPGNVVLTQGFIGATNKGVTTTIGRGGSDYSAAIFGAALGAEEIQIWTDVDGVLSADPTVVPGAKIVRELSFNEAAELAYFGAKVLHPSTILPAIEKNIPVRVLNSRKPESEGTRITKTPVPSGGCAAKSVAYRKGITIITIQSTRMLMGYGFLARVFDIFARHHKSIDVVVTSEVSISLTVDDPSNLEPIIGELKNFATVRTEPLQAILCIVGEGMKSTRGIAGRIFKALGEAGINIELISQGGSEINLTCVVSEAQVAAAVRALHAELFKE